MGIAVAAGAIMKSVSLLWRKLKSSVVSVVK